MAKFTTRVVLHDSATWETYEELHAKMKSEGFSRTITSGDGTVYHLPDAEYNREGPLTRDDVLASAKRAAGTTGHQYSILITESDGRTWVGLREANLSSAS